MSITPPSTAHDAEDREQEFYTLPQVAELLQVSRATVQNLVASGDLEAVRIGARIVRVTGESLAAAMRPYTSPRDGAA